MPAYHIRIVGQGDGGALREETLPVEHYTTTEVPSGAKPLGGIYREGVNFELTLPPGHDLLAQLGKVVERLQTLEHLSDEEAAKAFDRIVEDLTSLHRIGSGDDPGASPTHRRPGRVVNLPQDGKMVIVMDKAFNTLQTYRWPKGPRRFQRPAQGAAQ